MRKLPDDLALNQALRDGLQALPVPDTSLDFDARVLAALHVPRPWGKTLWGLFWEPARPLLLGASCSLAVTLLALHWALSGPVFAPRPPAAAAAQAAAPVHAPSLDALLDRPDLRAGSLAVAWTLPPPAPARGRRPAPPRHAQSGRRDALVV